MASTLKDIAKVLVDKHQLKQREAENFTNAFVDTVLEGLQNDRLVKIKGLGTFKLTAVRDRESVNVNTGERIVVSGHDKISFTPDAVMRDMVNKPFAQFETIVLADGVKFDDIKEEDMGDEISENPVAEVAGREKEEVFSLLNDKPAEPEQVPVATETEAPQTVEETISPVEEEVNPAVEEVSPAVEEVSPVVEEISSVIEEVNPVVEKVNSEVEEVNSSDDNMETAAKESLLKQSEAADDFYGNDNNNDGGTNECKKIFILYALISNVVFIGMAFVLGYLCCSNKWLTFGPERVSEQDPAEVFVDTTDSINQARVDSIRSAALGSYAEKEKNISAEEQSATAGEKSAATTPAQESKSVAEQKKGGQNAASAKSAATSQDKAEVKTDAGVPDQSQYNKDARVRTGAYYIIGTQATVKVKPGQTLKSISKAYLGEGMECYVEAYNGGVTALTEGQTVKIPKLQLKKKKAVAK